MPQYQISEIVTTVGARISAKDQASRFVLFPISVPLPGVYDLVPGCSSLEIGPREQNQDRRSTGLSRTGRFPTWGVQLLPFPQMYGDGNPPDQQLPRLYLPNIPRTTGETSKAAVNGHTFGSPRSLGGAEAKFSERSRSLFDTHCNTHGSADSVPPATSFMVQVISRYSSNRLPTTSKPIQPHCLVAANWDHPPTSASQLTGLE